MIWTETERAWNAWIKNQNLVPPELMWAKQIGFRLEQLAQPSHPERKVHEQELQRAVQIFSYWRARRLGEPAEITDAMRIRGTSSAG